MLMGWLIYSKDGAHENQSYIEWFIQEAELQNIKLQLIYRESLMIGIENNQMIVLQEGKKVAQPDFAVIRTIEPFLQVHLEKCGIRTFNSSRITRICNDKILTHLEISELSIPTVDTYFYKQKNITEIPTLEFPFVVKAAKGRSGKHVYLIKSHESWTECLQTLGEQDLLIQSANVQLGKDVRVFVVGKEIVSAVLRHNDHDFRANFKLGGKAYRYNLSLDEQSMIKKIVNHFNFDLVGIDFLISNQGELLFNEIEEVVGSRILSQATQINLLQKYVTHIKQELEVREGMIM